MRPLLDAFGVDVERAVEAHYGAGVVREMHELGYDALMLYRARGLHLSGAQLEDLAESSAGADFKQDLLAHGRLVFTGRRGHEARPTLWERLASD